MPKDDALVWFRRDLRAYDHGALFHALKSASRVHCVFVFDTTILDPLPRVDRRVEFILRAVEELDTGLREKGGGLIVRHGNPLAIIPQLATELGVAAVYSNRDYEPAAVARDTVPGRTGLPSYRPCPTQTALGDERRTVTVCRFCRSY